MRFAEVIRPDKYPGGVLTIPNTEFTAVVNDWAHQMGKRFGYRRETRMEHWQEAIDTVYTSLEEKLQTTDEQKIMSQPKWEIMMLAAQKHFSEHIRLYHPSPVEQQKVSKLVRISKLRRTLKNKLELMRILKQDKELKVRTLTELAVSRLECEVLATSAEILVAKYRGAYRPPGAAQYGVNSGHEATAAATAGRSGMGVQAAASASALASAEAKYDSGKVSLPGGFTQRVQMAVEATAALEGSADAQAKAQELAMDANAGLGADTQVNAKIDYEISRTCKVKAGYLRRILGPKFKLIEGHIHGAAQGRAGGSVAAGAELSLKGKTHNQVGGGGDFLSTSTDSDPNKASFRGGGAQVEGEVELAVRLHGTAGVTVLQSADITVTGDLFAGAQATGEAKVFLNGRGVGMDIGGQAMAGFEVGSDQTLSLRHPSRNVSIFSLKVREAFSAGVGVEGEIKGRATCDQISFNTSAGATVGIGSSIGFNTVISPRGVLLAGYDLIAVPTILRLGDVMRQYDPKMGSIHTRRMNSFCEFLNRQASKGEVTQVYLDNCSRIQVLMAGLDAEGDALLAVGRSFRTAGYSGYQSMGVGEAQGTSLKSDFFEQKLSPRAKPLDVVFGSEASAGDAGIQLMNAPQGDLGKTITMTGLQTGTVAERTAAVQPAKDSLHTIVSRYEAAKTKGDGSGHCIAYEVLRKDMLSGTMSYL